MNTDRAGFMHAIIADPADDTARLVFADWLQEHGGEPERADFIRVQCELGNEYANPAVCKAPPERVCRNRRCPRRLQIQALKPLEKRESELFASWATPWWFGAETQYFRFDGVGNELPGVIARPVLYITANPGIRAQLVIRRGFVDEIHCLSEDWFRAADHLHWHPEQTIDCESCIGWTKKHNLPPYNYCSRCVGGRVPRPVPSTSQPIRKVVTPLPGVSDRMRGLAHKYKYDWPPTEFGPGHATNACRFTKEMFEKEWPGIEFEVTVDTDPDADEPVGLEESAPHV